jgi:predicted RNA-binding Zn ribbon-like protein
MSPRYDVPNAAPEPLRQVQLFINSVDLEHEVEWLPGWLSEHGLEDQPERALELREALRSLVRANNGASRDPAAVDVVNGALTRLTLRLDAQGGLRVASEGDALDDILVTAVDAMLDGSWARLKACRNCRWAFYAYSPNRSGTWCSMQLCGNRKKTGAYGTWRRRQRL